MLLIAGMPFNQPPSERRDNVFYHDVQIFITVKCIPGYYLIPGFINGRRLIFAEHILLLISMKIMLSSKAKSLSTYPSPIAFFKEGD